MPPSIRDKTPRAMNLLALAIVILLLTEHWLPLGPDKGLVRNLIFCAGLIFGLLGIRKVFTGYYRHALAWMLDHKARFLTVPITLVVLGLVIWLGFDRVFGFIPDTVTRIVGSSPPSATIQTSTMPETAKPATSMPGMSMPGMDISVKPTGETPKDPIRASRVWQKLSSIFPGLGKEFMPDLEEGTFLYMPTLMPHASIGQALDVIHKQNLAIKAIPEVQSAVGKIGRVESALDPAPISMIETIINFIPEYKTDPETGHRVLDPKTGKPIRQWRPEIQSPNDIWNEIVKAAHLPGTTVAPKLQPIAGRVVMLQTGMRAAMGIKIRGNSQEELEKVGLQMERYLREVPSIEPSSVIADRNIGVPYLEIDIDRQAIARYGVNVQDVNDVIEIAIGGRRITTTVEGRERYPVRVRYDRELRDSVEALGVCRITLYILRSLGYERAA
jgi:Cu(I)/Ag(I) efflux system membrane protein CusA/SilA